jgi:hypothetical protein
MLAGFGSGPQGHDCSPPNSSVEPVCMLSNISNGAVVASLNSRAAWKGEE